jgi:DHA1 family multidrug resistance protein-like MFS transporter
MEFSLGITDQTLRLQYISIYQLLSMLSMCAAMVVWGTLADRFGRKLMLLRASFAAAIFYPLIAFVPNIWLLFIVRFVCSFFSGTYNPAQTLAISTTPPEKHGFALGLLSTDLWSGYMAGYLAGGIIASRFGFTVAFVCGGTLYFVSALLILFLTKDNFSRQNCLKKIKKERMPLKKLLSPGVCGILLLILIMGIAKRVDEPFLTELVDDVMRRTGSDELNLFFFRITGDSLFFTGLVSAGAAS